MGDLACFISLPYVESLGDPCGGTAATFRQISQDLAACVTLFGTGELTVTYDARTWERHQGLGERHQLFQVLMKTQPTALPHLGISAGELVTSRDSLLEEKTSLHIFNWFQSPFWLAESC